MTGMKWPASILSLSPFTHACPLPRFAKGIATRPLHQEFERGISDERLLPEVGRRRWVLLTKDDRIRRRPLVVHFRAAWWSTFRTTGTSQMIRHLRSRQNACSPQSPPDDRVNLQHINGT